MPGAQKISSRSMSLTTSDTKALLLRAEALLALEKGVGKRIKRNLLTLNNDIQDELRNF